MRYHINHDNRFQLQDTTSDVISKFLLTCGQFGLQYRLKKSRTYTTVS